MQYEARAVTSNQDGVHDDLPALVRRYQQHRFLKPMAKHSQEAFDAVAEQVAHWRGPLVLDSCCGVGESTAVLASRFPDALVIGVDKSAHRLQRNLQHQGKAAGAPYLLLRADLNDFWRLAAEASWQLDQHFLLYPNPWPKQKHVGRRWHGSPVLPSLVQLGGELTVRSNWQIYIDEFATALELYGIESQCQQLASNIDPITPFERKYQAAQQALWQLRANLTAKGSL